MTTLGRSAVAVSGGLKAPVFPVSSNKVPACPHGCKDATADPQAILRLFDAAPSAAFVAIATGEPSGLAAIDIDPAALPWFEIKERLFRPTWKQRTPRGGYHLLYRWPPGLRNSAGKLAPAVDVRGSGGSCIVYGPAYEVVDDRDPAPFPAWVEAALRRVDEQRAIRDARLARRFGADRPANVPALVRFVMSSGSGERNARLFWAARKALSEAMALLPAAVECGLPLPEARATILSAMRRSRGAS